MNDTPTDSLAGAAPFADGQPVILQDRKERKYLLFLREGKSFQLRGGQVASDRIIGRLPGLRVESSSGEVVSVYRPTLEEYVLLMPRGAQIVGPKDIGHVVLWGDIFPGATVLEAGIGSGALTLGLLRAVGPTGRVIAFELREDFANCARNNILAWPESLADRLEIRPGNVHERLGEVSNIDRMVLDLPDPWNAVEGAALALRPGGLLMAYSPNIRQLDTLVQALLDHPSFFKPDVTELIQRPWVADRLRLRPELRIVGHTGFLLRTRRRIPRPAASAPHATAGATTSGEPRERTGDDPS